MKPATLAVAFGVFLLANTLNAATLALNASTEQCRLLAYDDKQPNKVLKKGDKILGTLTLGYGSTGLNPYTGTRIAIGDTWTQQQADVQRIDNLHNAETFLRRTLDECLANLNDNQFGALIDFVFNVGSTGFLKSQVYRALKAGHIDLVPNLIRKSFLTAKGKPLPGLIIRRAKEAALFEADEPAVVTVAHFGPASAPSIKPDPSGLAALLAKARALLANALSSLPELDETAG